MQSVFPFQTALFNERSPYGGCEVATPGSSSVLPACHFPVGFLLCHLSLCSALAQQKPQLPSVFGEFDFEPVIKPLIEKKRRERINASLSRLKTLLQDPPKPGRKQSQSSRLDKAHILEMAVLRVQGLQQAANQEEGFSAGFTRCLSLIQTFLASQAQLGSTLQPKLAEYLSSALKPTQLENQRTALQLMLTDGQHSTLQLIQADHQCSVLNLIQARAGGHALKSLQEETVGYRIKMQQTENQDVAPQPLPKEKQRDALQCQMDALQGQMDENNGQVRHMSQTSALELMQVQNRCSVLQEKQGCVKLLQEPGPQCSAIVPVMQEKDENSVLQVARGTYQSSVPIPPFAQNPYNAIQTTVVKNSGSLCHMIQKNAVLHQKSKNQDSVVQLQQSGNPESTPLLMQATIQDTALCTMTTLKQGKVIQPLHAQNQRHVVKYQQNQTSELQQITNQNSVHHNVQTQNCGNTLGHMQSQSVFHDSPSDAGVPYPLPRIHSREAKQHKLNRRTPKKEKGYHDKENLVQDRDNQSHEQENINPGPAKLWHSSDQTPSPWERPVDCRPQPWKGARRLAFAPPGSEAEESPEASGTPLNKRALIDLRQAREQWVRAQARTTVHAKASAGPRMAYSPAPWQCPSMDPMWRPW